MIVTTPVKGFHEQEGSGPKMYACYVRITHVASVWHGFILFIFMPARGDGSKSLLAVLLEYVWWPPVPSSRPAENAF